MVQAAEQRIEDHAPGQRAHDLWDDVRHQQQPAEDSTPARQVVQQQGCRHPERQFQHY